LNRIRGKDRQFVGACAGADQRAGIHENVDVSTPSSIK
jgi:hypothetical protein